MKFITDLKIIGKYLQEYRKEVTVISVLSMVYAIASGVVPYIYGKLVDFADNDSTAFIIFSLLGIWVLTTLISAFLRRAFSNKAGTIAGKIQANFICEKADHIIRLPLSFHREIKIGDTFSRVNRAGDAIQNIVDNVIFGIFPQLLTVIVGLIILLTISWELSLGTLVLFFVSISVSLYRTKALVDAQTLLSKKFEKGSGYFNDSLLNIHTIKSSGAELFQGKKISETYRGEVADAFKGLIIAWNNNVLIQEIVASLGFVIVFGYAIFLLSMERITGGALVMFLGYFNLTRMPLRMIIWQWFGFQRGMAAIKRAQQLLEIEPENYNENGKEVKDPQGKVEYKNICFGYEGKGNVLKNISFTALPGQKIALVGGSGEGKTTTIDLLSRYFSPNKGEVLLDDVNIKELKLKSLRNIIAYVPQEIILFNDTVKNNILYGKPKATEKEIIDAAKAANIHEYIERLPQGYDTMVGERGIKVSTGQKQRLAIARAIIRNPKILVLDEATSSLDVQSEKLIQEALERLEKNKTTFIIAHRLSTVRKADKILVLEKGKIIEQGNHEELMKKKGAYHKFYNLQFSPHDIIQ